MRYQQLTEGQRYQIACLHDHGLSQAMIARKVGVHPPPLVANSVATGVRKVINQQRLINRPPCDDVQAANIVSRKIPLFS